MQKNDIEYVTQHPQNDQSHILWELIKEKKIFYCLSIICLTLSTLCAFLLPFIIQIIIDVVLVGSSEEVESWVYASVQWLGGQHNLQSHFWISFVFIFFLGMMTGVFTFFRDFFAAKACESTLRALRNRLFQHLHALPADYMSKIDSGDVLQRCTSDLGTLREFFMNQVLHTGRTIILLIVVVPLMFMISVPLTVLSLGLTPLIFLMAWYFYGRVKERQTQLKEAEAALTRCVQENFSGVRVVKAFARQSYEIEKFDLVNQGILTSTYSLKKMSVMYKSTLEILTHIQTLLLLILGAYWVMNDSITIGMYFAFTLYLSMIIGPIKELGRDIGEFGKANVAVDRLQDIFAQPTEITSLDAVKINHRLKGDIEFNQVSFGYQTHKLVLNQVSFKVPAGQTVAIVGPTGAGKSTLIQLILRFYEYQSGSITIDGMELNQLERFSLRDQIGILLQEPFLFSRSIRDNIKFGYFQASDKDMMQSTQSADIDKTIESFEQRYDTLVGEKGVTLSGGQCQRVSLARTLLKNQPILILDDTLSAVDAKTEQNIIQALHQKKGDQTLLIITHRLSVCQHADNVIVLEEGQVTQKGHHNRLKNQPGLYQYLWNIQQGQEKQFIQEVEENA